jgi:hypothetical protein
MMGFAIFCGDMVHRMSDGWFFLKIWAVARHIRRMDEYQRRIVLESLAIAAAVTAGVSFTCGFPGLLRAGRFTAATTPQRAWRSLAQLPWSQHSVPRYTGASPS